MNATVPLSATSSRWLFSAMTATATELPLLLLSGVVAPGWLSASAVIARRKRGSR